MKSLVTSDQGPRGWLVALVLVGLVIAAYLPGVTGGFVFDDFPNIVENERIRIDALTPSTLSSAAFSSEAGSLQRPIAMVTFAINHYFTGYDASAMKWTNIAIHAINALLVFGLVTLLLRLGSPTASDARRRWAAAFVAAAWALQPINFLGVLYIVQRMESLSHLFVFVGLWLYLIGRDRQLRGLSGRWPLGIGLFGGTGLAMLCKESGALLPLYAWLLELCLPALRNAPDRRRVQLLFVAVLWLPLAAGLAWLMPYVVRPESFATRDFTLVERLLTEPRVLFDYLQWSLLPRLEVFGLYHDDYVVSRGWLSPVTTLWSALGLVLLVALAWWLRKRRPITSLGLLWFLAGHAMTATVIPLELVYEHRNYFPSLGLCLVLADVFILWPMQPPVRRIGGLLAVLTLLTYGGVTHLRAREWNDSLRFAQVEAAKHPNSPRATYGYARMLVIATNYDRESKLLKPAFDALERARRLPKSGILPHSAFLLMAEHTDTPIPDAWWDDTIARLRKGPIGPQEINAIGSMVRCERNNDCAFPQARMVAVFEAAIARAPLADLYAMYGDYTLNTLGRPEDAIELSRRSIEVRPDVAQYRINLTRQLIYVGRIEEARAEIAALRAMGRLGQNEVAAAELEQRIPLAPDVRPAPPAPPTT